MTKTEIKNKYLDGGKLSTTEQKQVEIACDVLAESLWFNLSPLNPNDAQQLDGYRRLLGKLEYTWTRKGIAWRPNQPPLALDAAIQFRQLGRAKLVEVAEKDGERWPMLDGARDYKYKEYQHTPVSLARYIYDFIKQKSGGNQGWLVTRIARINQQVTTHYKHEGPGCDTMSAEEIDAERDGLDLILCVNLVGAWCMSGKFARLMLTELRTLAEKEARPA